MANRLLGKEWFKLCDDFISHETVYIDQEWINRSTKGGPVLVEGYMRGDFDFKVICRLICRHGDFQDYRVVLQGVRRINVCWPCNMAKREAITVNPGNMEGHLMFVLIRELIQNIDNVLGASIPSLVRIEGLQLANEVNCPCWELRQDSLIVPSPCVEGFDLWTGRRVGQIDRKLDTARGAFPCDLGQSEDDIVKDRPQFANTGGDRTAKLCGDLLEDHESIPNYFVRSFRLLLGDYSVRMGTEECSAFKFEVLDVFPGCIESFSDLWYVVSGTHVLYSKNERQEDAKDTQGSRDTHTKPRGLSKEPRPSGKTQETLTASTLSEPKLETERGHPRGDYTAKHTHIDSLEDA
jgi:hypothetical protein